MSRKTRRKNRKKKSSLMAAPEVAVTVAVATPEQRVEKYGGGSMMVPPEREGYVAGSIVQLLKKILKPLSADQRATRAATRSQASYAKDMTGAVVVAGGIGYNLDSDEGQTLIQAADAGEIDVEVKNVDERINPNDYPTYVKGSDSANAFQDAFREAREARADTFEFEGRTYLADLPVNREGKAEGGIGGLDTYLDLLLTKQVGDAKVKANTKISDEERNRQLKLISKNFSEDTIGFSPDVYREAAQMPLQEQIQRVNENLREQVKQFLMGERTPKAEGGEFPDLTGDGKVTRADVLKGRGVFQEGGEVPVDTYPNIPPEEMAAAKASQLPDEQMEDEFIDYVMNEALNPQEQTYLMNALEDDPQLSMIFDKVVGTASEFTGSGEVTGPGTGVSDSIPARLSDGEFVFTRKATDQLGAENLQRMMDDAERAYDGGLMKNGEEMERNINEVMMSANQMPSLNVRQR